MADYKPKLDQKADLTKLPLSREEGFLLSRIDGQTTIAQLSQITRLPEERVWKLLRTLADQQVLQPDPSLAAPAEAAQEPPLELEEEASQEPPLELEEEPAMAPLPGTGAATAAEQEEQTPEQREAQAGIYRKIYLEEFQNATLDARLARAHQEQGVRLGALCLDPDPKVVRAIFDNTHFTMDHARLIAQHHRTTSGLEVLGGKQIFVRDGQVRKHLLRNYQTSDALLRKSLLGLSMGECFRLTVSREISEKAKRQAREILRKKFTEAQQDLRAELILRTEARCLLPLAGMPLGDKTVALLANRSINSTAMAMNLARFSALPPLLIRHLLRQNVVRTNAQIKKTLLNHPNCSLQIKKELG